MTERDFIRLGARLIRQLETVSALVAYNQRRLAGLLEVPRGKRHLVDLESIHSELEEAERLLAVTTQDLADLEPS